MIALLFVALLASSACADPVYQSFISWMAQNNKVYNSAVEHVQRFQIYKDNLQLIARLNANPNDTAVYAANKFADMTSAEWQATYLHPLVQGAKHQVQKVVVDPLRAEIDWRTKGAVTGVKDQGSCGSCWAFSSTGALEGAYFLKQNSLLSFSEQELVDCDTKSSGCNGGLMDTAFEVAKSKGMALESEYPYTAVTGTCSASKIPAKAPKASGYTFIADWSAVSASVIETALQARPLAFAADATNWSYYSSGIFSNCATNLNHGILLVGYNEAAWIVKNSWGASWGENGYIRLKHSSGATPCGMNKYVLYPEF